MINQPGSSTWDCPQCGEINDIRDRDCPNCRYINPYWAPPPVDFGGRVDTPRSPIANAIGMLVLGLILGGAGFFLWRDSVSDAQAAQARIQTYQSDCSSAFVAAQTTAIEQAQSAGDSAYWQYLDQHANDPCRVESVSGYFYYKSGTKGSSPYHFHQYNDHNHRSNDFTIPRSERDPPIGQQTGPIYLEVWNDNATAVTAGGIRYMLVNNPIIVARSTSGLSILTSLFMIFGFSTAGVGLISLIWSAAKTAKAGF